MPNASIAARKWAKRQSASAVMSAPNLSARPPVARAGQPHAASHLHALHGSSGLASPRRADSRHAKSAFDGSSMFDIERRFDALARGQGVGQMGEHHVIPD